MEEVIVRQSKLYPFLKNVELSQDGQTVSRRNTLELEDHLKRMMSLEASDKSGSQKKLRGPMPVSRTASKVQAVTRQKTKEFLKSERLSNLSKEDSKGDDKNQRLSFDSKSKLNSAERKVSSPRKQDKQEMLTQSPNHVDRDNDSQGMLRFDSERKSLLDIFNAPSSDDQPRKTILE